VKVVTEAPITTKDGRVLPPGKYSVKLIHLDTIGTQVVCIWEVFAGPFKGARYELRGARR
jgi:hypothetical protein